jgi:nicotinamidase-related amidase
MEIGHFSEQDVANLAQKGYQENPNFDIITDKCALLVIDMQDEFVKPHWSPNWLPEATLQVQRIKRLMEHCRHKYIPVIYTVFSRTHQGMDRPKYVRFMPLTLPELKIDWSQFFRDGKIWSELKPLENEVVIHKPSYGAFYDTPLETILKNTNRDTVIICGCMTNYCCGTTARQAYERSFKVIFGSDVNATDDPEMQAAELKTLRRGFAKVLSCEEIIEALA